MQDPVTCVSIVSASTVYNHAQKCVFHAGSLSMRGKSQVYYALALKLGVVDSV